jgi:hypothetical protein
MDFIWATGRKRPGQTFGFFVTGVKITQLHDYLSIDIADRCFLYFFPVKTISLTNEPQNDVFRMILNYEPDK